MFPRTCECGQSQWFYPNRTWAIMRRGETYRRYCNNYRCAIEFRALEPDWECVWIEVPEVIHRHKTTPEEARSDAAKRSAESRSDNQGSCAVPPSYSQQLALGFRMMRDDYSGQAK